MRKYIAGDELISKVHGHGPKNGILREAAKKSSFFSGPATKAFTPPPLRLSGH